MKESENANIRAAFVHILGDIVQSIGVVVGAIIIMIKPEWKIVDPICTFFFATLVSVTTYSVIRDCLRVLVEGTPADFDIRELEDNIQQAQGVKRLMDMHVWNLTHGKVAMTAVVESESLDSEGVLRNVTLACRKSGIYHSTIQVMNKNELDPTHASYSDLGQNVH